MDLCFPANENLNMEMALFDRPIVLQYDVIEKYRLISRKFSGMKFFHPCVRVTNQKPRTLARLCTFDKPIKSLYFRSFVVRLFCSRVFISRSYENRSNNWEDHVFGNISSQQKVTFVSSGNELPLYFPD